MGATAAVSGRPRVGWFGAGALTTAPAPTPRAASPNRPRVAAPAATLAAVAAGRATSRTPAPMNGSWASHERGPTVNHSRASEIKRNLRTTVGSNWEPAHFASSARAARTLMGFLYERAAVMVSNESVTVRIRPPSDSSGPGIPRGYPRP